MTTIIEKVLQLQDVDLFRFTNTENLAQLASVCEEEEHRSGSLLFRKGEECKTFHLLIEGQVNLESDAGAMQSVRKCALDHWSFLAQGTYRYSATCLDDCVVYTVSYEEIVDLLTAEPEFSWAITRYLAEVGSRTEIDFIKGGSEH